MPPWGNCQAAGNIRSFEGQDGAVLPLDHGDDAGAEVSAGHQRAGYGLAAEGTEPGAHIDEFGVLSRHALEPAGRLQRIAGAIVEVAEHVPLPQVMDAHVTRLRRNVGHRPQCAGEVTSICLGAGGDDARFGEHFVSR